VNCKCRAYEALLPFPRVWGKETGLEGCCSLNREARLGRGLISLPDKQPDLVAAGLESVLFSKEEIGIARLCQAPQVLGILDDLPILDNLPSPDDAALHSAEVHEVVNPFEARVKYVAGADRREVCRNLGIQRRDF